MTQKYTQENKYILAAIDASGYDVATPTTDKEKLQFLHDTFHSEYDFNIKRIGEFAPCRIKQEDSIHLLMPVRR